MPRHLAPRCYLWLLCACPALATASQPSQDALLQRGERIAQMACSSCHIVAHPQQFPPFTKLPAPSFFEIAAKPQVTPRSLRQFIASTHWDGLSPPVRMPNPGLTPAQIDAVVKYILSLRAAVPPPGTAPR